MAYFSDEELFSMNFKSLGKNVKISKQASIYNCDQIEIGDNSRVDDFCVLSGKIVIGKFNHITPMCLVAGGVLGVYLDDFVTLAYGVKVFSQSDDYSGKTLTNSLVPKKFKNETYASIVLKKHVIVGTNSVIFPGVEIAEGCSIAACSMVNKSTAAWGIYAGVPAKRIKERSKELLILEEKFLREVDDGST